MRGLMTGLGIIVRTMLGMNPGVQPQISICFRLRNASSGRQIVFHCSQASYNSDIKKDYHLWHEYDQEDRDFLLKKLEEMFMEEILTALQKWEL